MSIRERPNGSPRGDTSRRISAWPNGPTLADRFEPHLVESPTARKYLGINYRDGRIVITLSR